MPVKLQFVHAMHEAENVESFYFIAQPKFAFTAGQYLMCDLPHADVDERGTERAFTVASAPSEPLLRLTTRFSQQSSSFKKALRELAPGSVIEADGPFGNFVYNDDGRPAVFIAGGIGITPFRSMLGDLESLGHRRSITLLYSNSTPDIAFRGFFDDLAAYWPEMRAVYTITRASSEWQGTRARIDAHLIREHVADAHAATFYVCGPSPMVAGIRTTLAELGVDPGRVVFETFPGYEVREHNAAAIDR
jgi:ferredoxin-NADP reductase